jgi:hypothetical protein
MREKAIGVEYVSQSLENGKQKESKGEVSRVQFGRSDQGVDEG